MQKQKGSQIPKKAGLLRREAENQIIHNLYLDSLIPHVKKDNSKNIEKLDRIAGELAQKGGLEKPETEIVSGFRDHFAFVDNSIPARPVLKVNESVFDVFNGEEVEAVVAHEMDHIKNRVIYHKLHRILFDS
jgi:Zn-dependent protease with chaperone function